MLSLFSITNTMLFRSASPDAIERFRTKVCELTHRLGSILVLARPEFKTIGELRFIELEIGTCLSLYPASIEYKEMHNIPIFEKAGSGTRHFEPQYKMYLKIIYAGIIALQEHEEEIKIN